MDFSDTKTLAAALDHLARTVDERANTQSESSYTSQLLMAGSNRCAKKFGEEAVELALALVSETDQDVAAEAADLLYHLFVALRSRGVCPEQVGQALVKRQGMSGLEEKASRS